MVGGRGRLLSGACALAVLTGASAAFAQSDRPPPPGQDPVRPAPHRPAPPEGTGANASDAGQRAAPTNQDVQAASGSAVSEVIVTGVRSNSVQQTPAAVSVFTDERRNLLGVTTAQDVANLTPSTQIFGDYIAIRGVGRFVDAGVGLDPGVAVHVDGVYTSSPAYLGQPDFLTDRIEVLRGPQSIFGRNNTGGTVNVYSRRPTDEFHGDLRAGYTDSEYGYLDAAVSGPLVDKLKFRVAFSGSDLRDGTATNVADGYPNPSTGQTRLFEAQLQYDPTPDIDVWFRYQNYSANNRATYGVGGGSNVLGPYNTGSPANYTTSLFYGLAVNPQYGIDPNSNPTLRDKTYVSVDDPGHSTTRDDHTFTINASWDMHWAKLKYIGGYSQYETDIDADADLTDRATLTSAPGADGVTTISVPSYYTSDSLQTKKWYSNELILSSPEHQRLSWLVGFYDYSERYKTFFSVRDPNATWLKTPYYDAVGTVRAPDNPTAAFYAQETTLRSDNEAIYGELDYELVPGLKLTGAFRYNWDQRYGYDGVRFIFDIYSIYGQYGAPRIGQDVTPTPSSALATADFDDWSGKIGLQWRPDPTIDGYVNISRGYKSGGFDLGNFRPIPVVKPELVTDYEAGIKKTIGRQLFVDAAAYYYDYNNLQVPITLATPGPVNPITGASTPLISPALVNAQRTESYGFELEGVYSPLENLHLTLVYSYQHAAFRKFTGGSGNFIIDPADGTPYADLKGNTVPQVPENKITLIPNYIVHTGYGDLSLVAIGSFIDSQYYAVFNTPNYHAPSYYNLDLRAVFQPTKSHWTAILYARNVTASEQFIFKAVNTNVGGLPQTIYTLADQRAFGAELQYRF